MVGDRPGPRHERPFDVGLQPERTALAWRRTGLAILAGSLVAIRILPEVLGAWSLIPAGGGVVLAVFVVVAAHRRYREQHRRLTSASNDRIALPDGALPAVVAVLTLGGGVAALVVAISVAR